MSYRVDTHWSPEKKLYLKKVAYKCYFLIGINGKTYHVIYMVASLPIKVYYSQGKKILLKSLLDLKLNSAAARQPPVSIKKNKRLQFKSLNLPQTW